VPSITIDVRMARHAGIGTYIRNVVPRVVAARPDWRFTLLAPPGVEDDWGAATVRACTSDIYTVGEQVELAARTPRSDLFWSPHYNIPIAVRSPLVVTVHDVGHLALPEMYGGPLRQGYARFMFGSVKRRAREIIFDSDFTRAEFLRLVGQPRRWATIPLGVDASWSALPRAPSPHPRPYLLFVGSTKPHKNIGALLRAFESLAATSDVDLIIVGGQAKQRTIDTAALHLAGELGARVRVVSGAPDDAVKQFVANAAALVLPSLYEGFGLPALEAMAAGAPCIVSNAASLPEVGGHAVLYCDPRDPADIARQIQRLLTDTPLRDALVAAGRARAARFSWDTTASMTLAVLERALGGGSAR